MSPRAKAKGLRKKIAGRVRGARLSTKQTTEAAAKRAGVNRFVWLRFELGQASIPSEMLPKVAQAVDLEAVDLLAA